MPYSLSLALSIFINSRLALLFEIKFILLIQASKQASKQTSKQASKQTSKQTRKQASKQASNDLYVDLVCHNFKSVRNND